MRFSKGLGGFVLLSWICVAVWAQKDRLQELEQKILKQQQQILELETQVEEKESSKQSVKNTTPTVELEQKYTEKVVDAYMKQPDIQDAETADIGYDHGFFIRAGELELKFKGEIMWHANFTGRKTVQNDTFTLRRNRLDTQVTMFKDWHARIRIDAGEDADGSSFFRVREAYIDYLGLSYLKMRAGVTKVPFSMEFFGDRTDQLAITYSPFVTIDSMPRRDAGIVLYGDGLPLLLGDFFSEYFSYSVGFYNGDSTTLSNDGDINTNADDEFSIIFATRFFPFTQKHRKIFFHAAMYAADTDFREEGARIRLDGLQNHTVYSATTGTGVDDISDTKGTQLGFDLGWQYWEGNFRFEGEFVFMRLDRDRGGDILTKHKPLEMYGIGMGISYFIAVPFEENMGLEPLFKFSYTTIDDQKKEDNSGLATLPLGTTTNVLGQDIWEVVLGFRFHLSHHARIDFNYIMYDLEHTRTPLSNKEKGGGDVMHSWMLQFMARW